MISFLSKIIVFFDVKYECILFVGIIINGTSFPVAMRLIPIDSEDRVAVMIHAPVLEPIIYGK